MIQVDYLHSTDDDFQRSCVGIQGMWKVITQSLAVTVLYMFVASIDAAETVVDNDRGLTIELPEGFMPNAELQQASPDILYGFLKGDPDDDQADLILFLQDLGGLIGRDPLTADDIPADFKGRLFKAKWQGFEVDGFEVPEQIDGREFVTYNVQLPVKPSAVQVKLFGPRERDDELKSLLPEVLRGIRGESNWILSVVDTPFNRSDAYGTILLGIAIIIVLGGLIGLYFLSQVTPRGTVLGLGLIIWLAGFQLGQSRIREVVLVGGALSMLGVAGGIAGVIEFVRRRKEPIRTEEP